MADGIKEHETVPKEQRPGGFLLENGDGFRLKHFEVLNFGTFHHQIWGVDLEGENCLLTGEIGSGKSTLVDAMTTLLVPSQKIVFNKAAGATTRERDLRSYVMGYYRAEGSGYGNAKPVSLRPDHKDYTVILAVFHNETLKRKGVNDYEVTLALVLWMNNAKNQPERFYVTAERALSIKNSFTEFGSEPAALKKRLRREGANLFDTFSQYSSWWRMRFGLYDNEQALDLFAQTVSMKTVENISSFVQTHMLQKVEVDEKIDRIIDRFNDLNSTYDSVCRARDMLQLLLPMQKTAHELMSIYALQMRHEKARDMLHPFIGLQRLILLEKEIVENNRALTKTDALILDNENKNGLLHEELRRVSEELKKNGGEQLESLKKQMILEDEKIRSKKANAAAYESLIKTMEMNLPRSVNGFLEQKEKLKEQGEILNRQKEEVMKGLLTYGSREQNLLDKIKTLEDDIAYIGSHKTNIDIRQQRIREGLCEALHFNLDDLPFVGELIEVRESEKEVWEGAIERVLHGFALSMLVGERYYHEVLNYVDTHNLKGRLVFYLVKKNFMYKERGPYKDELKTKLVLKEKGELTEFIRAQLDEHYAFVCTSDYARFKLEPKALTPNGQVKSGQRHEKDDRHELNDRKNYVLGISNTDKLLILNQSLGALKEEQQSLALTIGDIKTRLNEIDNSMKVLTRLDFYKSFEDINYHYHVASKEELLSQYRQIEEGSDVFRLLTKKVDALNQSITTLNDEKTALLVKKGKIEQCLSDYGESLHREKEELGDTVIDEDLRTILYARQEEVNEGKALTLAGSTKVESDIRKNLDRFLKVQQHEAEKRENFLIQDMTAFNSKYEVETREIDPSPKAWPQYEVLLKRIEADDLPRFVELFKKKLKNNTINDIATLNAFLDSAYSDILKRIADINKALNTIEYNPGRHIQLVTIPTEDLEIRRFKQDLRQMVDNRSEIDSETLEISEEKFKQVKELIDRFKGRPDFSEADSRFRQKVTDVRRWYEFAAQELYDFDGSQYEFYKDSSGKSGGQKEKLAYTILATSLAYQFGTGFEGQSAERSFRFVIIDEAFGRGSDESAAFGLKLFAKLKLQLLVVTPMQKISIIEPYVSHVAFILKNEDTSMSAIRNLTIEEYRLLKKQRELLKHTAAYAAPDDEAVDEPSLAEKSQE